MEQQEEIFVPGSALAEEIDQKLMIVLRDGRKIIGTLRSFDQFANLVIVESMERIFVGEQFGDIPLGLQLIRGENVVLLGRVDADYEVQEHEGLTRVSEDEIKQAFKAEKEAKRMKATMR
eukprot:gene23663-9194_t